MTLEVALVVLAVLPMITSVFTEFAKWLLDLFKVTYASNVVVLAVACVIGGGSTILYYLATGVPWTALNVAMVIAMILVNAVGAALDYDKAKQLITQIMAIINKK